MKKLFIFICISAASLPTFAQKILIYMDLQQTDHLKAYGVAYWALERGVNVEWLLNYRSGSFMLDDSPALVDRKSTRLNSSH